jgi:hypothetical protein
MSILMFLINEGQHCKVLGHEEEETQRGSLGNRPAQTCKRGHAG